MSGTKNDAETTDVLVVGSGIAGCSAALAAARAGADVLVATKATRPENASTHWAQGGIAVTRDDPESLRADVLTASANTADPDAVDMLVENANDAVTDVLIDTLDVSFDTDGEEYDYGREAAHSEKRILHVDASTGQHVLGPFLSHLDDHPRVTIHDGTAALSLVTREGRVHGAMLEREGDRRPVFAGATVLATGGVGALYGHSTNPASATGDGIAMAALAGAKTADMAYVQFHPTAYSGRVEPRSTNRAATPRDDSFLVSEAVRGEGAVLRNADGERFMTDVHPDAELAPRDVVARAVQRERERTGEVVLDTTPLDFAGTFPDLAEKCDERGVPRDSIPVAPSEHFLCGGIDVDDRGRTSLDRLSAVGECARTGVHGANRLASTSLLEGLVWGLRAGETAATGGAKPEPVEAPDLLNSDPALPDGFARDKFARLRAVMDECVGLTRTPDDLRRATAVLRRLKGEVDAYARTRTARDLYELRNATVVALLVARDALDAESVGCHHVEEVHAD
ncbi:L-aspartate oxidase [Haladaptatus paucihalophilus]|uniref:L-aspartate oxidase n=2 Tax=Haladaptatus paucihalophilus DX253 TaxID=797209 RepID=A0A1M6TS47_HALPU|nr:FAD-dependent oxidoreductase [Haladaptatus paucihalophilus]SHK59750.1 L-aspartate oxidase [Haladaptatus paucihalophilus DX253]